MLPNKHSFRFVSKKQLKNSNLFDGDTLSVSKNKKSPTSNLVKVEKIDNNKRTFLKLAGIAGLGIVASQLLPKKAGAYVMGSSPTSNVVGVKDSTNARIDPAKETGGNLATVKTNTDPFVTSTSGGYVRQDSTGTIAKETGGNLASIKTNTDNLAGIKTDTAKFKFIGDNLLVSGGVSGGGGYEIVGLKDSNSNTVNPASDDAVVLLRRMVKIMESQATVDAANRQRVAISEVYGTGASVALQTPRVTVANDSVVALAAGAAAIGSVTFGATASTLIAGQNQQMYQDPARNAFANGIRQNLIFS